MLMNLDGYDFFSDVNVAEAQVRMRCRQALRASGCGRSGMRRMCVGREAGE